MGDERIVGAQDADYIFECTVSAPHTHAQPALCSLLIASPRPRTQRYVWRNNRQSSELEDDRKFATRRMALLYVAKMNSDSFRSYLTKAGKQWSELCSGEYPTPLEPNRPFDSGFLDLSDDVLDASGHNLALVFAVHKAPRGTVYECQPRRIATTGVRELAQLLGENG